MRSRFIINKSSNVTQKITLTIEVRNTLLTNLTVNINGALLTMTYANGYYSGSTQVSAYSSVSYSITAKNYISQSGFWAVEAESLTKIITLVASNTGPQLTVYVSPEATIRWGSVTTANVPIVSGDIYQYPAFILHSNPTVTELPTSMFSVGKTLYYRASCEGYRVITGSMVLASTNTLNLNFVYVGEGWIEV